MVSPATPQRPGGPQDHYGPASYPAPPPRGPVPAPRQAGRPRGASAIIPPRALDLFNQARRCGWFTEENLEPQDDDSTLYTLRIGRKLHPDEIQPDYVGDTYLYTLVWTVPPRLERPGRGATRANVLRDRSSMQTPTHRHRQPIPAINDILLFIHRNPRPRGSKHAAELRIDRQGRSRVLTPEDRRRNGVAPDTIR